MLKSANTGKILLLLSFAVFLFYLFGFGILSDVYKYAVVGAVFELLWLPMLMLLAGVTIAAFASFFQKTNWSKLYSIASLLLIAAAISIMLGFTVI